MSLLGKAYEKFDNVMLAGANRAVHAWNWTTGGTKADLANLMESISAPLKVATSLNFDILFGSLISALLAGSTAGIIMKNRRIEKLENDAKQMGLLSRDAESWKEYLRNPLAPINSFGSFFLLYNSALLSYFDSIPPGAINLDYSPSLVLGGIGFGLSAESCYVMCTDSPPPRKNCVSRGIDAIVEGVRNYQARPSYATAMDLEKL